MESKKAKSLKTYMLPDLNLTRDLLQKKVY